MVEKWKYQDGVFTYDDSDELTHKEILISFFVHTWVCSLNSLAFKIYKKLGKCPNKIKMNLSTFELLAMGAHDYYRENKLGHYLVEISERIKNDTVFVYQDFKCKGKLEIIKQWEEKQSHLN